MTVSFFFPDSSKVSLLCLLFLTLSSQKKRKVKTVKEISLKFLYLRDTLRKVYYICFLQYIYNKYTHCKRSLSIAFSLIFFPFFSIFGELFFNSAIFSLNDIRFVLIATVSLFQGRWIFLFLLRKKEKNYNERKRKKGKFSKR